MTLAQAALETEMDIYFRAFLETSENAPNATYS